MKPPSIRDGLSLATGIASFGAGVWLGVRALRGEPATVLTASVSMAVTVAMLASLLWRIYRDHLRRARSLDLAVRYGGIDGDHHKTWVIDQMVRALTGCAERDESEEYRRVVADAKEGEDGPATYSWETGIAP